MSARVQPNFITDIIESDLELKRVRAVVTRFPPEPNGYAHLGHTFACFLNYTLAEQYGGSFVLRMDDTNPLTERQEYVDAIRADLEWMGWRVPEVRYASDDFEVMYACAVQLIEKGLAYVDSLSPQEMAQYRGTPDKPGTPSPYRDRSVVENLDLFQRMRAGEFPDGAHVLRAKIDLTSSNMKLRDPGLYRILHAVHYRQGEAWSIYPLYDYAQSLNDAINGVTHSLCSLEFVDNRAIYDWLLEHISHPALRSRPHQYEFGRRSLEYTVVSKRKLRRLIEENVVSGWDDPRMPTIAAQRRRGVTPEGLRAFAGSIGVSRTNRTVDIALLEHAIRDDLNARAPRVMAVLRPVRLTITNLESPLEVKLPYYPPDVVKDAPDGRVPLPSGELVAAEQATRAVTLTRDLYIERDDISTNPPPGYKRLTKNGRVRLRGAGVVECQEIVTNEMGNVLEARCVLLPEPAKAGGVIHWVSATHGVPFEARLYDRLFRVPNPEREAKELEEDDEDGGEERDFLEFLNPKSLEVTRGFIEPSVLNDPKDARYQFERNGYFWQDPVDSSPNALVFNQIIALKDPWAAQTSSTENKVPKSQPKKSVPYDTKNINTVVNSDADALKESMLFSEYRYLSVDNMFALSKRSDYAQYFRDVVTSPDAVWQDAAATFILNGFANASEIAAIEPYDFADFIQFAKSKNASGSLIKSAIRQALDSDKTPRAVLEDLIVTQISDDSTLGPIVAEIIAANPDKLEAYRGGRTGLLGFFVGEVMKRTKGAGNPGVVQTLVKAALER
jgi:glutaminyl-tRNA synthetase